MGFLYDNGVIDLDRGPGISVNTDVGGQWTHYNSAGAGSVGTGPGVHTARPFAYLIHLNGPEGDFQNGTQVSFTVQ